MGQQRGAETTAATVGNGGSNGNIDGGSNGASDRGSDGDSNRGRDSDSFWCDLSCVTSLQVENKIIM